jgi:hypothetical protein
MATLTTPEECTQLVDACTTEKMLGGAPRLRLELTRRFALACVEAGYTLVEVSARGGIVGSQVVKVVPCWPRQNTLLEVLHQVGLDGQYVSSDIGTARVMLSPDLLTVGPCVVAGECVVPEVLP